MILKRGDVAIVTGASRGLGVFLARELAGKGMSLVLAARSQPDLDTVAEDLRSTGVEVVTAPTDVADEHALQTLVDTARSRFGRVDVLVNNAGFDYTLPYDQVEIGDIQRIVAVNLTAPMVLARLVLPLLIEAGRGHIVNVSSLAGLLPSPYEELYAATKHGLVGFTRSLRASIRDNGWPLGASVVCPGFMDDAGIYEDLKNDLGVKAPAALGSISAAKLGRLVVRAIEKDLPDVLVTRAPARVSAAMLALAPRLFESISSRMNTAEIFREVARAHVAEREQRS